MGTTSQSILCSNTCIAILVLGALLYVGGGGGGHKNIIGAHHNPNDEDTNSSRANTIEMSSFILVSGRECLPGYGGHFVMVCSLGAVAHVLLS